MDERWIKIKENAINALNEAKKQKKVDHAILNLLDIINKKDGWASSSSCAGRIVIIRKENKKEDSAFLFKWHRKISKEELREALMSIKDKRNVFLRVESFIIHVLCKDVESAKELLKKSRIAGVKKGGIQTLGNKILVELRGNVNLSIPTWICYFEYELMMKLINETMDENDKMRKRLESVLNN